ncbi:MAG: hypothetical protein WCW84_10780 [Sulfurimonas sp.]|jgi:hypothetical protein
MKISNNELFGPVLSNVYKLESTVAEYPRIVVGENLIKFLNNAADKTPILEYDKLNIKFAKICLNVIARDTDGVDIIDYLCDDFEKYLGQDLTDFKYKAYETLAHEYQLHINNNDQKLAQRYFRAIDYFEARLNFQ